MIPRHLHNRHLILNSEPMTTLFSYLPVNANKSWNILKLQGFHLWVPKNKIIHGK